MSELLAAIVKNWKSRFEGVTALALVDLLKMSHDETMAQLRLLEGEGSVTLHESQVPRAIEFREFRMKNGIRKIPLRFEKVATLTALPSRRVLEDAFHADRVDYGEFGNRLHLGLGGPCYFERDVLDRYLKHPDRYIFRELASGGYVMTPGYHEWPHSKAGPNTAAFELSFGSLELADGSDAVGVVIGNLADLPRQEQHHWAAYEVLNPALGEDDWTWRIGLDPDDPGMIDPDYTQYVEELTDVLSAINTKHGLVFHKTEHPRLHVPTLDTFEQYTAAHNELFKLIGPDNMDQKTVKELLRANGCDDSEFLQNGRPKGTWALFKMLARRKGLDWAAFEIVASKRQQLAHEIPTELTSTGKYYPRRFRQEVQKVIQELYKLA